MASHDLKSDNATHEEIHEQASAAVDSAIHHPKGWWSWQLVATSELFCPAQGYHADILAVICIGCSMGLFGYDNSFAAPLISLPLFIAKYQGPAASFTV